MVRLNYVTSQPDVLVFLLIFINLRASDESKIFYPTATLWYRYAKLTKFTTDILSELYNNNIFA